MTIDAFVCLKYKIALRDSETLYCPVRVRECATWFYETAKAGARINYNDTASSVNLPENGYTKTRKCCTRVKNS